MNLERLAVLVEGYVEGTLSPGGRQELERAVGDDPAVRERFEGHVRLGLLLDGVLHRGDEEGLRRRAELVLSVDSETRRLRVLKGVEAQLGSGAGQAVRRSIRRRRALSGGTGRGGIGLAVAAAAVVGFVGLVVLSAERRGPDRPAPPPRSEERTEPLVSEEARRPEPAPVPQRPTVPSAPRPAEVSPATPAAPLPDPPPPPVLAPPAPRAEPPRETLAAVAAVDRVEGEVFVIEGTGRRPLRTEEALLAGGGLETGEGKSAAALRFTDGTRIELEGETKIGRVSGEPAKRVDLVRGFLRVHAARQPDERPLVLVTPHAEVKVLGTRFTLAAGPDGTRVEVTEGRVRARRLQDGAMVDVAADHFALVARGIVLASRPTPIDEIVLFPAQARILGQDWTRVRDEESSTGTALDAPRVQTEREARVRNQSLGFVEFAFRADPGKEYHVWIRGACMAAQDRSAHDMVLLIAPGGRFSRSYFQVGPTGEHEHSFNGYGLRAGYAWVGGNSDRGADGVEQDVVPVSLRFARGGEQKLRIYPWETPMRIDAVWLSATQKVRPAPDRKAPGIERR